MKSRFSFNINAELFENQWGDLAIRFPGERVFDQVGTALKSTFLTDATDHLKNHRVPEEWHEIPAHELLYASSWQCISRLGFIDGDDAHPALELELPTEALGPRARTYLKELFEEREKAKEWLRR